MFNPRFYSYETIEALKCANQALLRQDFLQTLRYGLQLGHPGSGLRADFPHQKAKREGQILSIQNREAGV